MRYPNQDCKVSSGAAAGGGTVLPEQFIDVGGWLTVNEDASLSTGSAQGGVQGDVVSQTETPRVAPPAPESEGAQDNSCLDSIIDKSKTCSNLVAEFFSSQSELTVIEEGDSYNNSDLEQGGGANSEYTAEAYKAILQVLDIGTKVLDVDISDDAITFDYVKEQVGLYIIKKIGADKFEALSDVAKANWIRGVAEKALYELLIERDDVGGGDILGSFFLESKSIGFWEKVVATLAAKLAVVQSSSAEVQSSPTEEDMVVPDGDLLSNPLLPAGRSDNESPMLIGPSFIEHISDDGENYTISYCDEPTISDRAIRVAIEIIKTISNIQRDVTRISSDSNIAHNNFLNVLKGMSIILADTDTDTDTDTDIDTDTDTLYSMCVSIKKMHKLHLIIYSGDDDSKKYLSNLSAVHNNLVLLAYHHIALNNGDAIYFIRKLGRDAVIPDLPTFDNIYLNRFLAGEPGNVMRASPVEYGALFLIDIILMAALATRRIPNNEDAAKRSMSILAKRLAVRYFFTKEIVSVSLYSVSIVMAIASLSAWRSGDNVIQSHCSEEREECSFAGISAALKIEESYLFLCLITNIYNGYKVYAEPNELKSLIENGDNQQNNNANASALIENGDINWNIVKDTLERLLGDDKPWYKSIALGQGTVATLVLNFGALSMLEEYDSASWTVTLFSLVFTSMVAAVAVGIVEQAVFHNDLMKYLKGLIYTASGGSFHDKHIAHGSSNPRNMAIRVVIALLFLFSLYTGSVLSINNARMLFREGLEVDVVGTESNQLWLAGNLRGFNATASNYDNSTGLSTGYVGYYLRGSTPNSVNATASNYDNSTGFYLDTQCPASGNAEYDNSDVFFSQTVTVGDTLESIGVSPEGLCTVGTMVNCDVTYIKNGAKYTLIAEVPGNGKIGSALITSIDNGSNGKIVIGPDEEISTNYVTVPLSSSPTVAPTVAPTVEPSKQPSPPPTKSTESPTLVPTPAPTVAPTVEPSKQPSPPPTKSTESPTLVPTPAPTVAPTVEPSKQPSPPPTKSTESPTLVPTVAPSESTASPTVAPSESTASPTLAPTDGCKKDMKVMKGAEDWSDSLNRLFTNPFGEVSPKAIETVDCTQDPSSRF